MAIAFRTNTNNGNTGGTTATLTIPGTAQVGDVAIAVITVNNNKSASLVSTGSAFTLLGSIAADSNATYAVYYRVIQLADISSNFTWTWTGSDGWGLVSAIYSGVDTTTPEDVATPSWTMESSTAPTSTDVTTFTNNAWALAVCGVDGANNFNSVPTGYTSRVEREGVGAGHKSVAIADKVITPAGATGAVDWIISGTAIPNAANHVILRPAGGAGAQTVAPGGIASTAAIGSHGISSVASILPSNIQPTTAFGTSTVRVINTIIPSSIESTTALGLATLRAYIHAAGIASTAVLGVPQLTSIAYILPVAIDGGSSLGTPVLTSARMIVPASIDSTLVLGTSALTSLLTILANGIPSTAVVGTPELLTGTRIIAQAIQSTLQYGQPQINLHISATSVGPGTTIGIPSIGGAAQIIQVSSVLSSLVLGTPVLSLTNLVLPTGIDSTVEFGVPRLQLYIVAIPVGSTVVVGQPTLFEPAVVLVIAAQGIASTAVVGVPTLLWLPVCLVDDLLDNILVRTSNYQASSEDVQYGIVRSNGIYSGHNDWSE